MLDCRRLLFYNARYYDPNIGRFISADTIVPGNASGGMDGVAVKPLTVSFHEGGFLSKANSENRMGFWFQLNSQGRQQMGSPMGPANAQALNRYSYVQNNPLKYTDPSGHYIKSNCGWCNRLLANISGLSDAQKGTVVVTCLLFGCHIDNKTGNVWGPTTAEAMNAGISGVMPLNISFSGTFKTAKGMYEYIVEGVFDGRKFITSEVAIYPQYGEGLEPGAGEMLRLVRELLKWAKKNGIDEVTVNATRYYADGTKRVVQQTYKVK